MAEAKSAKEIVAEFLEMVERLYVENYALREIIGRSGSIPDWKARLQDIIDDPLLRKVIHDRKFAPLFEQLRRATQAEAVDEVLRSVEQASSEDFQP